MDDVLIYEGESYLTSSLDSLERTYKIENNFLYVQKGQYCLDWSTLNSDISKDYLIWQPDGWNEVCFNGIITTSNHSFLFSNGELIEVQYI